MNANKEELERLLRQLERLKFNFTKMVKGSEDADKMLDWINEIRRRIDKLKRDSD